MSFLLVTWLMFSAPGHPFLLRALTNLVDLIRLEYFHASPLVYSASFRGERADP